MFLEQPDGVPGVLGGRGVVLRLVRVLVAALVANGLTPALLALARPRAPRPSPLLVSVGFFLVRSLSLVSVGFLLLFLFSIGVVLCLFVFVRLFLFLV